MVMNYFAPVLSEGSLNSLDRRWPMVVGWFCRAFDMQLHIVFWSSRITRLVLGIVPMGFFPRTPSFFQLVLCGFTRST